MNSITFYYDIGCPFAYIAAHRISALAARCNSEIIWKPILLGGLYQHHKSPEFPAQAWSTSKARHNLRQLHQEAERYDVPLNYNPFHPQRTVNAMRLLLCAEGGQQQAIMHALFKAYWQDGHDFTDDGLLDELAEKHGLTKKCYLESEVKNRLRKETETAAERGVFGVPTFEVNDKLFWGQDRMHFLRAELGGPREDRYAEGGSQKNLTLYHDFASPFSYLGFKQMAKFQSDTGHKVTLKPILLGAVFKEIGTPMVPLFAMSPEKQKYVFKDLLRWAEWWGIPFAFPGNFPLRSVLPLRVALVEPALTDVLYSAFWTRGEDVSKPEVIATICQQSGFNADGILQKSQAPETKALLKRNTKEAIECGVCGVPSWDVEGEIWWGQDRLLSLASRLSKP